ncbi:hypothetical protein INT45_002456 [Circinella minor]|uniref:SH3 domain-containing protein n=1 Tax=Circinella minor TaxID=1195481 RepID=A0A8H7SCB2_9FUNG|nr:hypothetical protein INT45_002456 [Circinella minor]
MTLLKLTRKGTIAKKSFRTKKNTNNDEGVVDDETSSFSSEEKMCYDKSSTMLEKVQDVSSIEKSNHKPAVRVSTITVSTRTASIKTNNSAIAHQQLPEEQEQEINDIKNDNDDKNDIKQSDNDVNNNDDEIIVTVRDFAYSESSPLHHGEPLEELRLSQISLSSSEFTGRQARALYDFTPETEYEIGMKAGDAVWVQYRQCPGWLIADVMDETGLVPESYVEFI